MGQPTRSLPPKVIELTALRLQPGTSPTSPLLLKVLQDVRTQLNSNSRFFHIVEEPSLIYLAGLWTSVRAHNNFLMSPSAEDVLKPQEDLLEWLWTVHVEYLGGGWKWEGVPLGNEFELVRFERRAAVGGEDKKNGVFVGRILDVGLEGDEVVISGRQSIDGLDEAKGKGGKERGVKHGRDLEGESFRKANSLEEGWECK